jgi:hypothetical protein
MTLQTLSVKLGFSSNYFNAMKMANRKKFDYIFSKSEDLEKAAYLYDREVEEIYLYIQDLYYSMRKKDFFDLCKKHNVISQKKNCDYSFEHTIFKRSDKNISKPFEFVMKLKKFIKEHQNDNIK